MIEDRGTKIMNLAVLLRNEIIAASKDEEHLPNTPDVFARAYACKEIIISVVDNGHCITILTRFPATDVSDHA